VTLKILKGATDLTPDQAEFVGFLRGLVDAALAGELVGLVGVTCDKEGEIGYAIGGEFHSAGEMYLGLHNAADMVRAGDLESLLGLDDDLDD
jgi:hypothetical protein